MILLPLIAALASPAALAEDPEFAGAEKPAAEKLEETEKPETTLSAEFGGTWVGGNSAYYTLNGAAKGSHQWNHNKLAADASINLGKAVPDTDGDGRINAAERDAGFVENARRYEGNLRYDRFLSERDSLYVLVGAYVDPFSGYDLRSHEQLGYSRILVKTDATDLTVELGFDQAQENYVEGIDPNVVQVSAARAMAAFTHAFNEDVGFGDTVEVYENVADTADLRVLNELSISSRLSGVFSLKLSHKLAYDHQPVPGYGTTDQTAMVTLVASIL